VCNKKKIVAFVGFHLTFLCVLVVTLNDVAYTHSSLLNLWYPFIVYLIGLIVFNLLYDDCLAFGFYLVLSVVSLVLILPISVFTYVLLSLLPLLLYNFCLAFFQIDERDVPRGLSLSIWIWTGLVIFWQLIVNGVCDYFSISDYFIFSRITIGAFADLMFILFMLFTVGALIVLAKKNKSFGVLKFSKLLTLLLISNAMTYPLLYVLNSLIVEFPIHPIDTLYTLLALPLIIGYILLENNSIIVYYNKREVVIIFFEVICILCTAVAFFIAVLGLSEKKTVTILFSVLFGIYFFIKRMSYMSYSKIDNINENLYENRKTELLYQLRFQELLRNYIIFVLHQLKYSGYPDAFICRRKHAKVELFDENSLVSIEAITNYFDRIMSNGNGEFVMNNVRYLVLTFSNRLDDQGFLAIRGSSVSLETVKREVQDYLILLEQISELEFLKQTYKSLPGIRQQDFVIEKYHYEITRMQQDESQYLHDVALQKMLSIKNFLEIIEIPNVEFKEYLLTEIRDLNASLITHMYDLFPFTLKNLSLYECICELMTRLKKTTEYQKNSPTLHLVMNKTLKVPRYFFYPIYSFIKELLWNVFATAEATIVEIRLYIEHGQIIIQISDDGNRKNMQDLIYAKKNRKNGILIINYEVKELNGTLFTELNYPTGSIITIKLPYKGEVNQWK